jgi:L-lactate dehydrogenase
MKIGIVGTGSVGATVAYSIAISGLASRLVLMDAALEKAIGEAMDLEHCASFIPPVEIEAGGIELCRDMEAVVITAGIKRKPGENRTDLIRRNLEVFREISLPLSRANPEAVFIVVSNPVDLLTLYLLRHSSLSTKQVIGTGTLLDTSRLRHLISKKILVDPRNVHAYVIGEHGMGSVPLWSCTQIGALPLDVYASQAGIRFGHEEKEALFARVLSAGQDVIERKGATYYGIAQSVQRILTAISRDEKSILTVSTDVSVLEGVEDVAMSLPVAVGRHGAEKPLKPRLAEEEMKRFLEAGSKLKGLAREVGIL